MDTITDDVKVLTEKEKEEAGLITVTIAVLPGSYVVSPRNDIYDTVDKWFKSNPVEPEYISKK